ncbi:hypothetical protein [Chromohalobacter sp. 48-RD10]|uniref:aspartate/glutamate racemase family protein n=1 Tax=Chromohalobacter sp. 48-RD10 TaxID=2994063 RepID=UPI002468639A|nr:hypothetical protein [Chromohalobacter sp. 48-RD10]
MRTIGLLGGMSWESTESYYRALNEGVKQALGGLHSAKVAMVSVDFAEIETLQSEGRWDAAGEAQAVILGCTEIAMLIKATDTHVPLYDTTALHAEAAVTRALAGSPLSADTQ